jgi:predicted esterase
VIPVVVGSNPISHPISSLADFGLLNIRGRGAERPAFWRPIVSFLRCRTYQADGQSVRRCVRFLMIRLLALLPMSAIATAALAAPGLSTGFSEFKVELPESLRKVAGRGKVSPVTHALVTIAVPANFDAARAWPVLIVSATTDPGYNSSRRLLREYAATALASGWIVLAADAAEGSAAQPDEVPLRLALNMAALAALERQWPGADKAPLAFGGFSGGGKLSGWLAAAFVGEGRTVIGLYLAGVNEETLVPAATMFKVLDTFRRIPVFLQAGEKDEIAKAADHRDLAEGLKQAGFRNVYLEYVPGAHDVDPAPLHTALDWFRDFGKLPPSTK